MEKRGVIQNTSQIWSPAMQVKSTLHKVTCLFSYRYFIPLFPKYLTYPSTTVTRSNCTDSLPTSTFSLFWCLSFVNSVLASFPHSHLLILSDSMPFFLPFPMSLATQTSCATFSILSFPQQTPWSVSVHLPHLLVHKILLWCSVEWSGLMMLSDKKIFEELPTKMWNIFLGNAKSGTTRSLKTCPNLGLWSRQ